MFDANDLVKMMRPNEKINYHKLLLEVIEIWKKHEIRPKVILHSCCAPCSTYTLEFMCEYADITILFANSNIHPEAEYRKRSYEQKKFIENFNKETNNNVLYIEEEYKPLEFFKVVRGLEKEPEGGIRCEACFAYRLDIVAKKAVELNYDYFGSALTLSPMKNSQLINKIGFNIQNIYSTKYLPSDFKKNNGYKRSIELCQKFDVYRQCYCGCIFAADKDKYRQAIEEGKKNGF
ncbi:epoxyqueuosine reductase QueH [Oceanivirga salmonicida]|uniref:epoxyqueuosine reductase QueH n=1 Tax=Oceanivirga salmonicida TaxID=1769291 RepID=UPI0012E1C91E|nr:epoxyqueuosine reductase QueH [Oceanivirga salmonicida]